MATFIKHPKGYRVQIALKGVRTSASFRTKREADAWAGATETAIRNQAAEKKRYLLHDLFRRYGQEVSPLKRGTRNERIRLDYFLHQFQNVNLADATPEFFGAWREKRLREVAPGTVLRDFSLLSSVFEHARREWQLINANPIRDTRKPPTPRHRDRLISRSEIRRMLLQLGYSPRHPIRSISQSAAVCFLLALRTGMRAGELCGLTWARVKADYCILPVTKTTPRNVPLDKKDLRLIEKMQGFDKSLVFGIKAQTLDALFRRARDRAGLEGFTFHDSRHSAATWLARRVDVLDLCKIFGWSNPSQAMVYFNPTPSDLARRKATKPDQFRK